MSFEGLFFFTKVAYRLFAGLNVALVFERDQVFLSFFWNDVIGTLVSAASAVNQSVISRLLRDNQSEKKNCRLNYV